MIRELIWRIPETHQEVYVATLEVILSMTAHSFDGGLNGLDRGLDLFSHIARMATTVRGGVWSPKPAKRRCPDRWHRLIHLSRVVGLWRAVTLRTVGGITETWD